MKTKVDKVVDKTGKKRLFSETSSPIKSNQKQESINEKKNSKKIKLAGSQQNENPEEKKVSISKVVNKIKQESSIVKPLDKKEKTEKTELTVKSKKETGKSRRRRPYNNLNLSAEQITKKIAEIKSRETLSKRAKKILGILNRKLRECEVKSGKLDTVEKKSKKAEHPTNVLINNKKTERASISKNKKKANDKDTKKGEKYIQDKNKLQKQDDDDDDDDDDDSDVEEDKDSDVDEESEEDESDESKVKNELSYDSFTTNEKDDDESDENEEDEEVESAEDEDDEEEIESEEDEEEVQGEEDEDEDDDEDDEDDEEDEEDDEDDDEEDENKKPIIKKPILSEVRNKGIQNTNEQEQNKNKQDRNKNKQDQKTKQEQNNNKQEQNKNKQSSDNEQKKKRYVLFVGNLPLNISEDEIKQHFLTKIDTITSIRIPTKPDKTPRGFAYVEVTNNIDFEKGLSLNHTFLKKRRINVEYSIPTGGKKGDATKKFMVAKNMKLQALQKAGKLAGGNQKRKPFKKEK